MKVTIVGPSSKAKGGIATVINTIMYQVDSKSLVFKEYSSWKGGSTSFKIIYSLLKLIYFPFFLLANKTDLVYIHFAHNGSYTRTVYYTKIAKFFNKTVVLHSHSSSFDIFFNNQKESKKRKIQNFFSNRCDHLIVLGKYWEDFYNLEVKVPHRRIDILKNATFCPPSYNYNPYSQIVTMFGQMGDRKGTYDVLRVAKKFKEENIDIQFKLYGDGEVDKVENIVKKDNLSNVYVGGWINEECRALLMSEAAINLLPSYNEGMPMAILESMALGIPNISTDVGSISEVIQDHVNGYINKTGDNLSLYTSIKEYMLSTEIERKIQISKQARATIIEKFNIADYGERLEDIIRKFEDKL